jgi:hypothetical protein
MFYPNLLIYKWKEAYVITLLSACISVCICLSVGSAVSSISMCILLMFYFWRLWYHPAVCVSVCPPAYIFFYVFVLLPFNCPKYVADILENLPVLNLVLQWGWTRKLICYSVTKAERMFDVALGQNTQTMDNTFNEYSSLDISF